MDKQKYKVAWLSAGVSSFISGYLAKDVDEYIYIDVANQHPDSMRFIKDCEKLLKKPITILKSQFATDVHNAILHYGLIRLVGGFAPCTKLLKKDVRKQWEKEHEDYDLIYVWGMDSNERNRAFRLNNSMSYAQHEFPLIDNKLTKADCHAMCKKLGIKRPKMYDLGYNNNNCIGCVKGGMGYWNKIRKDFPEVFDKMAKLERIIGASCINGVFLDELDPNRGDMQNEIMEDCNILCELALINKKDKGEQK